MGIGRYCPKDRRLFIEPGGELCATRAETWFSNAHWPNGGLQYSYSWWGEAANTLGLAATHPEPNGSLAGAERHLIGYLDPGQAAGGVRNTQAQGLTKTCPADLVGGGDSAYAWSAPTLAEWGGFLAFGVHAWPNLATPNA